MLKIEPQPKCWICGKEADSREHLIKASDIRAQFPNISQQRPIYKHAAGRDTKKVRSAKSRHLKTSYSICNFCNSTRTQEHDIAWQELSTYLQSNWRAVNSNGYFKLNNVFSGGMRISMLYVHLYFVKHFGCRAIDEGMNVNFKTLAQAILNRKSHPELFLDFNSLPKQRRRALVGQIIVEKNNRTGELRNVCTSYEVGKWGIFIAYKPTQRLRSFWHPNDTTNRIRVNRLAI